MEARAIEAQRAEENELLRAVARGDSDALRRLYRAFERPLFTLGMRWLNDSSLAEELVQEVTLRIWRRAGTFDPERGAASSWIFGVARNVAADLARSRRRQPVPIPDPHPETEPWDENSVWIGWQVVQALRTLPPEQQQVLELAYVKQMTQTEIAEHLSIPLGTVKTRIYSGLRRLKAAAERMGIEANL